MLASTFSQFAPSAHQIQSGGLGYRGVLTVEQLQRAVPAAFADSAHNSRSSRYAYIPTSAVIEGMRSEGFLPVKAVQAGARASFRSGEADSTSRAQHPIHAKSYPPQGGRVEAIVQFLHG